MTKGLETKGFQALSEEEETAVSGGGIASSWVQFGLGITNQALSATQAGLMANPFTRVASSWVGFSNAVTSSALANVINTLRAFGL